MTGKTVQSGVSGQANARVSRRYAGTKTTAQFRLKPACAAVLLAFTVQAAQANPTGASVVNGQASFAASGNTLTVTNTPGAIIHWQGFSIGANEITRFAQQSASSSVLNRVISNNPSSILGTLQSNGRVFLINPNGIVFGAGATVDVAGMVASTLNLSNADFLAGRYNFTHVPGAANISNAGNLTVQSGGQIYLIAPNVENTGVITAPNGEILLAAGYSVDLVDTANPNLRVNITAPAGDATNVGKLVAESGSLGLFGTVVRNSGTVSASSAVMEGGKIVFKASKDTYLDKDARVLATGIKGGNIEVLGNRVAVMDNAQLDVSGQNGGGSVLIGGDYQGKNPEVQNASITYFGSNASIRANALGNGDGGKVIVWADDITRAYGNISARGGAMSGNGGFVEVSGKNYLDFQGRVDTSAPKGLAGTLLLDPADIIIDNSTNVWNGTFSGGVFSNGNSSVAPSYLTWATINAQTGSVTIQTSPGTGGVGDININASGAVTGPSSLTLLANNNINVASSVAISGGTADLNLIAGWNNSGWAVTSGVGNINFGANSSLSTSGNLYFNAGNSVNQNPTGTSVSANILTIGNTNGNSLPGGVSMLGNNLVNTLAVQIDSTGALDFNNGQSLAIGSGAFSINGIVATGNSSPITLASTGNISINLNITINTGTGTVTLSSDSSGAGSGAIVMNTGSSITSNGGNITLGGGTAGNGTGNATGNATYIDGIYLDGATLNAGGGNISLRGAGFAGTSLTNGVYATNTSAIQTSGSGTITLNGTGGAGTDDNYGVLLGTSSSISSVNGAIAITGQGGAGTGFWNVGVYVHDGATVTSTGTGTITMNGTGGAGSTDNYGIYFSASGGPTAISSVDGAISITGQGAGIGTSNYGLYIHDGATVGASGLGTITLNGTGSATGTTSNTGIRISASGGATQVTSASGTIFMTGIGGPDGDGLQVVSGARVQSSTGAITLHGTGGNGGSANDGVYVTGAGTLVTSGGHIGITGDNLNTVGTANRGVAVTSSAQVVATGAATITMTGQGGYDGDGLDIHGGALVQSGTGLITLNGTSGDGTGSNSDWGVVLYGAGTLVTSGGGMTITGVSTSTNSADSNHGVIANQGVKLTTTAGLMTLTGTKGAGATSDAVLLSGTPAGGVVNAAAGLSITGMGDVVVDTNAVVNAAGYADILADNNILISAGSSLASLLGALNINLYSDFDGTGGGGIYLGTGSSINSNGGNIWMGGAPSLGRAIGNGTVTGGITFNSGITVWGDITAGAGNVTMYGEGRALNSGSNHLADGIAFAGGLLSSNGVVSIDGLAHVRSETTTGTEVTAGVDFLGGGTRLSTQTGTVMVTGLNDAGAGFCRAQGITVEAGTIIETTGIGTLTLNGTSTGYDTGWGVGIFGGTVRTTATGGGAITLNGINTTNPDGGVVIWDGYVLSGGGAINLTGQTPAGGSAVGWLNTAPNVLGLGGPNSGNITIRGLGTTGFIDFNSYGGYAHVINAGSSALSITSPVGFPLNNVQISAGDVTLNSGGLVTDNNASTNSISTNTLRLLGTGSFNLGSVNNDVAVLAANTTGNIIYRDANNLYLGAVTSFDGVAVTTTNNVTTAGNVAITAPTGRVLSGNSGTGTDVSAGGTLDLTATGIGYQAGYPNPTNRVGISAGGAVTLTTTGAGSQGDIYVDAVSAMTLNPITTDAATSQRIDLLQSAGSLTMPATQTGNDWWVVNAPSGIIFPPGSSLTVSSAVFTSNGGITAQGDLAIHALSGSLDFEWAPITASGIVNLVLDSGDLALGTVLATGTGFADTIPAINVSAPAGSIYLYDNLDTASGGISLLAGNSIDLDYNDIAPNLITAAGNVNIQSTTGSISSTGSAMITGTSVLLDGALGVDTGDIITATAGSVTVLAAGGAATLSGIDAVTDVSVTAGSIGNSGNINAGGALVLSGAGGITLSSGFIYANGIDLTASGPASDILVEDVVTSSNGMTVNAGRNLSVSIFNGGLIATGNQTINVGGNMTLNAPSEYSTDVSSLAGTQTVTVGGDLSLFQGGYGSAQMHGALGQTITVGGNLSLQDGTSLYSGATATLQVGNDLILSGGQVGSNGSLYGSIGRNVVITSGINGPTAGLYGTLDIGSAASPFTVGGMIYMNDGGGYYGAQIHSDLIASIWIYFPNLTSGGYFVNGTEGVVSGGLSGFYAANLPAVLDSNLHITYGLSSFNLLSFLPDLVNTMLIPGNGASGASQSTIGGVLQDVIGSNNEKKPESELLPVCPL